MQLSICIKKMVFLYRTMNAIVVTTKAMKKLEGDKEKNVLLGN